MHYQVPEKVGNILDAEEAIIVHQVNCKGVMGAGLAKQIITKWPVVLPEYKKFCQENHIAARHNLLGRGQVVPVGGGKFVANVFGQFDYGNDPDVVYTDYAALKQGLLAVKHVAYDTSRSIAIPYGIGCGLAHGDWGKIRGIITDVFYPGAVKVMLYRYN